MDIVLLFSSSDVMLTRCISSSNGPVDTLHVGLRLVLLIAVARLMFVNVVDCDLSTQLKSFLVRFIMFT